MCVYVCVCVCVCVFIGRTDAEAEAPILWPPDAKSQLIGKDPDAGKDWEQEKKGPTEHEMVEWLHWFNGHEFEQTAEDGEDKEAWCATVHVVVKNWAWFREWTTTTIHTHTYIRMYVCILFSLLTTQINILSSGAQSFPILHILSLLIPCFFDESHSTSRRWYLIAVLICISWLIRNAEFLFKYLLTIPMSSKEKYLFRSFAQFLIRNFFVGYCVITIFYILDFVRCLWCHLTCSYVPFNSWVLEAWSDTCIRV